MKRTKGNIFRMVCVLIAVVSVLCMSLAGNAFAGNVKISAADFTPDGGGGSYYKQFSKGTLAGDDSNPCLVAAVPIPGSAQSIVKAVVYLTDDGSSPNAPWFKLTGLRMATGEVVDYGTGEITEGTTTVQGIEIPVNMPTQGGTVYQLGTCLSGGQALYGVKIVYFP